MESGLIRKIVVGPDPKNGMSYYVGMNVVNGSIDSIILDEESLFKFSIRRYMIYVETEEGIEPWKAIESAPCVVEYNLKF